jgi:DNA topoisomerase-1
VLGLNPTAAGANGTPKTMATDIDCDECGKPMVIRSGRRGKFLGCSGYPKCKNTSEVPAKLLEELGLNGTENVGGNGSTKPAKPLDDDIETDLTVE